MTGYKIELYRLGAENGTLSKDADTYRSYDSAAAWDSSIRPSGGIGALSKALEVEDGLYEIDNLGLEFSGLSPEYFREYKDELESPFVVVVREKGASDPIFHGYVDPDSANYDAKTQLTSVEVFSWEKILKDNDLPARSIFKTNLAEDYRAENGLAARLYRTVTKAGESYTLFDGAGGGIVKEGDVVAFDTSIGEVRGKVNSIGEIVRTFGGELGIEEQTYVDEERFEVGITTDSVGGYDTGEGLVRTSSSRAVCVQSDEIDSNWEFAGGTDDHKYTFAIEDRELYEYVKNSDKSGEGNRIRVSFYETADEAASGNTDAINHATDDHPDDEFTPVSGEPSPTGGESGDYGEISVTPRAVDVEEPDGKTVYVTWETSRSDRQFTEDGTYYARYRVAASTDAGDEVRILSRTAYGQEYTDGGNYDTERLVDAMFRAREFGVLGSVLRNVSVPTGRPDARSTVPYYVEFDKTPLKALKQIAGTTERYIRISTALDGNDMPRIDVELVPRTLLAEEDALDVRPIAGVLEYDENPTQQDPKPVIVKANEAYRTAPGEDEPTGWYSESMDRSNSEDYTLNTAPPNEDDAYEIEVQIAAGSDWTLHPSDDGDVRNYTALSDIAKRLYEFSRAFRREANAEIIGADHTGSYVGSVVSASSLDFDSAGGRSFYVLEEEVNVGSNRTTLTGLVGEYTPAEDQPPVAKISGPSEVSYAQGTDAANVQFDGSDSFDVKALDLTYEWYVDGNLESTGVSLSLSGLTEGRYQIELHVSNSADFTDVAATTLTVRKSRVAPPNVEGGLYIDKERVYSGGEYIGRVRIYQTGEQADVTGVQARSASGRDLLPPSDPNAASLDDVELTEDENGTAVYEITVPLGIKHTSAIEAKIARRGAESISKAWTFQAQPKAEFEAQSATVQADGEVFLSVVADEDTNPDGGVEITHASAVSEITNGGGETYRVDPADLSDGYTIPNLVLGEGETQYLRVRLEGKDGSWGDQWVTAASNTYYQGQARVTNLNLNSGASMRPTGPNTTGDFHMMRDDGSGGYEYGEVVATRFISYDPDGNTIVGGKTVTIEDNFIQVNSAADDGTTGVANAGVEVNRGEDLPNQRIEFNEANEAWGSRPFGGEFSAFALRDGTLQENLLASDSENLGGRGSDWYAGLSRDETVTGAWRHEDTLTLGGEGSLLNIEDASGDSIYEFRSTSNGGIIKGDADFDFFGRNSGFVTDSSSIGLWGGDKGALIARETPGYAEQELAFYMRGNGNTFQEVFRIDMQGPIVSQLRPGSVNSPDGYGGFIYGETATGSTSTGKSRVLSLVSDEGEAPEVAEFHVGRWKSTTSDRNKTHAAAASHLDVELLSGDHHEYPNNADRTLVARFRDDARSIFYGDVETHGNVELQENGKVGYSFGGGSEHSILFDRSHVQVIADNRFELHEADRINSPEAYDGEESIRGYFDVDTHEFWWGGSMVAEGGADFRDTVTVRSDFGSANFATGFTGQGWGYDTENQELGVQNLTVRGRARFYELLIEQVRYNRGSRMFGIGGGVVKSVSNVSGDTDNYKITFEDVHGLRAGDFMLSQAVDNVTGGGSFNHFSVVKVVSVETSKRVEVDIDDNRMPSGYGGTLDAPQKGWHYAALGSTVDGRQGSVYLSTTDAGAPFIDILDGVRNPADWFGGSDGKTYTAGKLKVRLGNLEGVRYNGENLWQANGNGVLPTKHGAFLTNAVVTGNFVVGEIGGSTLRTDGSTLSMYDGAGREKIRVQSNGRLDVGESTEQHVRVMNSGLYFEDGNTTLGSITSGTLSIGELSHDGSTTRLGGDAIIEGTVQVGGNSASDVATATYANTVAGEAQEAAEGYADSAASAAQTNATNRAEQLTTGLRTDLSDVFDDAVESGTTIIAGGSIVTDFISVEDLAAHAAYIAAFTIEDKAIIANVGAGKFGRISFSSDWGGEAGTMLSDSEAVFGLDLIGNASNVSDTDTITRVSLGRLFARDEAPRYVGGVKGRLTDEVGIGVSNAAQEHVIRISESGSYIGGDTEIAGRVTISGGATIEGGATITEGANIANFSVMQSHLNAPIIDEASGDAGGNFNIRSEWGGEAGAEARYNELFGVGFTWSRSSIGSAQDVAQVHMGRLWETPYDSTGGSGNGVLSTDVGFHILGGNQNYFFRAGSSGAEIAGINFDDEALFSHSKGDGNGFTIWKDGHIQAAQGTFGGSLDAATGTFVGELSVSGGDVVVGENGIVIKTGSGQGSAITFESDANTEASIRTTNIATPDGMQMTTRFTGGYFSFDANTYIGGGLRLEQGVSTYGTSFLRGNVLLLGDGELNIRNEAKIKKIDDGRTVIELDANNKTGVDGLSAPNGKVWFVPYVNSNGDTKIARVSDNGSTNGL